MLRFCIAQYGVILDAGSSGTRAYVYKWKTPAVASEHASNTQLRRLPKLTLKQSKKIHPGVSTYAENVENVGSEHLKALVDAALDEVPEEHVSETPIFLMATAGVRFLPKYQQDALLKGVCHYLQTRTRFYLPDCGAHVQVISGETEGLYGWMAANYLLGGFNHPQDLDYGEDTKTGHHHTYGFLDMGGASAQIAFVPNSTEASKHFDDLKLVRLRHLDGSSAEYRVFTATWLGFGANKARERFVESLKQGYDDSEIELPDPCMPKGLKTTLNGEPVEGKNSHAQLLVGTGQFEECLRETYPLLGKDAPCQDQPCLLNGQHVPAIDFDVNHFIGVSEFWHTTHGVFGKKSKAYDLQTYQDKVMEFCSREWSETKGDLQSRKKTAEERAQEAREACFKASWIINVLYDGIGIPRIGIEGVPHSGANATKQALANAKNKGFEDPFRPVDDIEGVELSWTLGKMILYASGQVQPSESSLPVGFGSNVKSGMAQDFQPAGSFPLSFDGEMGDEDDYFDDMMKTPSTFSTGFILMVFVLLFLLFYLLRKPERRRKLFKTLTRGRRRSGSRKSVRGLSLANKLFRRPSTGYERVLEDGDAPEFELADVDSSENDTSENSEGSRVGGCFGSVNPKLNLDRACLAGPPYLLDRDGHAIRAESYERLAAPTVQMLNAGRRSRAGSPTRKPAIASSAD